MSDPNARRLLEFEGNARIPPQPQQTAEISNAASDFRFKNDLVGDANQYLLHLDGYGSDDKKSALIVFYWKAPIPSNVTISIKDRTSGNKICSGDPRSGKAVCDFEWQPEEFFIYHYAFEFVSNADLKIETRNPRSLVSFGP